MTAGEEDAAGALDDEGEGFSTGGRGAAAFCAGGSAGVGAAGVATLELDDEGAGCEGGSDLVASPQNVISKLTCKINLHETSSFDDAKVNYSRCSPGTELAPGYRLVV